VGQTVSPDYPNDAFATLLESAHPRIKDFKVLTLKPSYNPMPTAYKITRYISVKRLVGWKASSIRWLTTVVPILVSVISTVVLLAMQLPH